MSRAPDAPPDSDRASEAKSPRETMGLFGHQKAERELLDAYANGALPQAILIGGEEGIGKATLAWRLARFILCHPDVQAKAVLEAQTLHVSDDDKIARRIAMGAHGDVQLLRREWNDKTKKHFTEIRIEDVRKLIDKYHLASAESGWRIAIVDCAEDLNRSGANALLKLIEEPPPQCLFMIVSHRPGQLLPTLRSRCRKLMLEPLATEDVAAALMATDPTLDPAKAVAAAKRAHGSVREALRLIDGDGLVLDSKLARLLNGLPLLDWRDVHAIADQCTRADQARNFETFASAVFSFLNVSVQTRARTGHPAAKLEPLARAYDELRAMVREAEALNLDKRSLMISMFATLAETMGQAA